MTTQPTIQDDFPILTQDTVYLDSAATSLKPRQVIDAVSEYYEKFNANVHRGAFGWSVEATNRFDQAHEVIAEWFGADSDEIIFTSGATQSLNILAQSLTADLQEGDEIVLTILEHHSNLVPWQQHAKKVGAVLKFIELNEDGTLNLDHARELITDKTKIVSFMAVSNVLGTILPIKELIELAHAHGAVTVVDGAQHTPHARPNLRALGVDFYAFSGHKMYGPTGTGGFYGKRELLEELEPSHFGGGMISEVSREDSTWNELPHKFEPGTQNIAGALGMAEGVLYMKGIGMATITAHTRTLTTYAIEKLQSLDGVKVYGPMNPVHRNGVISFEVEGIHPHDVADLLNQKKVAIRSGHHCAMPLMEYLNVPGLCRASIGLYNTKADIDALVEGIVYAQSVMNQSV